MKTRRLNPKHRENWCVSLVKSFDFYKDLPDSLSEPTLTGAYVSIILIGIIIALVSSSIYEFLHFQKTSEIMIDVGKGGEKLHINLDITLPKCPCDPLSLDVVDITGVHVMDVEGKLYKHRLDSKGREIGIIEHISDEGHAELEEKEKDPAYKNTEEYRNKINDIVRDTKKALDKQEGCKLSGFVFINKVPGNFHISGHHYPDAVKTLFMQGHTLDFSHKINHLSFGDLGDKDLIEKNFGEKIKFELDGRDIPQSKFTGGSMFGPTALITTYFLEISQVDYVDRTTSEYLASQDPPTMEAYRYRSQQTIKTDVGMPEIMFRYELSPLRIQYTMTLQSTTAFLVHICAIVGGVYAVSSIFESFLRNTISIFGLGGLGEDRHREIRQ
jgi:hypothetical protein